MKELKVYLLAAAGLVGIGALLLGAQLLGGKVGLAVALVVGMVAVIWYIVAVENPRHRRRQRQSLQEKGYGFLLDDDEKDGANHTTRRQ